MLSLAQCIVHNCVPSAPTRMLRREQEAGLQVQVLFPGRRNIDWPLSCDLWRTLWQSPTTPHKPQKKSLTPSLEDCWNRIPHIALKVRLWIVR